MKNRNWTPTQAFSIFDVDSDTAGPLPFLLGIMVTCRYGPGPSTGSFHSHPSRVASCPQLFHIHSPGHPSPHPTLIPVVKPLMHYPKEKKRFSLTNSLKYFSCTVPLVRQPRMQLTKSSSQSDIGAAAPLSLPPETGKEKLKGGPFHCQMTTNKFLAEQIARSRFHNNDSTNMGVSVTCDIDKDHILCII